MKDFTCGFSNPPAVKSSCILLQCSRHCGSRHPGTIQLANTHSADEHICVCGSAAAQTTTALIVHAASAVSPLRTVRACLRCPNHLLRWGAGARRYPCVATSSHNQMVVKFPGGWRVCLFSLSVTPRSTQLKLLAACRETDVPNGGRLRARC